MMNSTDEKKSSLKTTQWCNESSDSDVEDAKNVETDKKVETNVETDKKVETNVERNNAKHAECENAKKVELADRKVPLLVQVPVATVAPSKPTSPCPTCNGKDDYKMVHCRNSENCRHGKYCVFIHDGEDRGCPRCRCGTCKNDRRFKTIQCTYYKKCKNGSRCPFMHHETDRGCGRCGDNKYSHSSRASPASGSPVPRASPASGSPVPRARPRELKVSPGPSAWSAGASPLSSPALPAAALSVPGSPVIPEPSSPTPSRVYLFTQMAVETYLKDGSTFVDKDGKKRAIYEKIDEVIAEAPMVRNLLLSYFQNSRLDCLQELYDRLEAIITGFPL